MAGVGRVNRDTATSARSVPWSSLVAMLKPEVDHPSDVDIAVEIAPKETDPERARKKNEPRARKHEADGNHFRGLLNITS